MPRDNPDIPPFLVLQHAACEPPAAFGDELAAQGLAAVAVELDRGGALPADPSEFSGLLVMGGPMGVYETDEHPWLRDEVRTLETALAADLPVWGVCLGAQLLAAALGAEVRQGPAPEVGVWPVRLTDEAAADPVFGIAPVRFEALHWHGDTYDLPDSAVRLAESDRYPEQAFRHGRSVALQFHLEVSPVLAREWAELPAYEASMERVLGRGALPGLVERVTKISPAAIGLGRRLFAGWLDEALAAAPAGRAVEGRAG